jgi:hypothetical protein
VVTTDGRNGGMFHYSDPTPRSAFIRCDWSSFAQDDDWLRSVLPTWFVAKSPDFDLADEAAPHAHAAASAGQCPTHPTVASNADPVGRAR